MTAHNQKPPRISSWIFRFLLGRKRSFFLDGDFIEIYNEIYSQEGKVQALKWYWAQLFVTIPPLIIRSIYWSMTMFGNYLKIASRIMIKSKGYSLINIVGLSVGMTCSILILLWVLDEVSFDKFHENADNLYIVGTHTKYGDREVTLPSTPTALGPALKNEYLEITEYARFANGFQQYVFSNGNLRFNEYVRCADASVLEMFSFPLLKGDAATALSAPHSVVMTERTARKYFGDSDPLGMVLRLNGQYDFTVTGILRDTPPNSSLRFDILIPLAFLEEDWDTNLNYWDNFAWETYILLGENSDREKVNQKIAGRINQEYAENNWEVFLYPYTKYHLFYLGAGGSIGTIIIFTSIALLVLGIACMNFMNLATARSCSRAKEIGLRKVVGASKHDIMKQFYSESFLLTLISLILTIVLTTVLLPEFNELTRKQLTFDFYRDPVLVLGLAGMTILTGMLSGSYPALFMSSFKILRILKGQFGFGLKGSDFRKKLVILQFCASIALIIVTVVYFRQLEFMHNKDLGFNKERLLYFRANGTIRQQFDTVKLKMLEDPNISGVTGLSSPMTTVYDSDANYDWNNKEPDIRPSVRRLCTDVDFTRVFGIDMAEGEFFSEELTNGPSNVNGQVVINEEFARIIGNDSPVGDRLTSGHNYNIIGIIKDFNFMPLYNRIGPIALYHQTEDDAHGVNRFRFMFIKIGSGGSRETIAFIEDVYHQFNPELPFEYRFLEDDFSVLYGNFERMGAIIKYFAAIAVIISCLGLFGLGFYVAERRTKEIGIRKVFGSSIPNIVFLLSREFIKYVVIANVIAWPVSWIISKAFLQNFAYRIDIGSGVFILTGLTSILIAFLTVCYQTIKAARANPIDALRYE
ncbi:ABC transporter permease [candidate division KSB1 bacterium]